MSESCTVLIAAPDLLPSLKKRSRDEGELLAFPDTDALRALEVISRRHPRVVALERAFASTPRGAALINRIKADPTLTGSEIRIVSHDTDDSRVVSRSTTGAAGSAAPAAAAGAQSRERGSGAIAPPLDQRGTRRAPRFRMASGVEVIADGNPITLIDLSIVGAQILSDTVLKPNQKLRMSVADEQATFRFSAVVAWASFEIPPTSGPRFRAGISFVDARAADVDAFRRRHG